MHHIKCAVLRDKMSFGVSNKNKKQKTIDIAIYSYQPIGAAKQVTSDQSA